METIKKKEKTMLKTNKKTTTEKINITSSTANILASYLSIYSSLNTEGKIQALKEVRSIGFKFDVMKKSIENDVINLEKKLKDLN